MESNDDQNLKAINESVGRLVWVRRRNGSWWPGQTLVRDQVPENSLSYPKVGTPIKLLGRDDVGVDWYVLEKSKTVKAFRCGEYDACIEKAKAAAAVASSSIKKTVKFTRREVAINDALEIENAHLAKEDHPDDSLCNSSGEEDSKRCLSGEDDEVTDTADEEETEDELVSAPELLQSSMSSQEMNDVEALKVQPRRRRTPNDSEDDGTEGIKRMRGLEDIGKEHVGAVVVHKQEMGLTCDVNLGDSMSNGNILANGNRACSPLSLKRKRSQVIIANECSKRKNRRRQLTKVLESTAMVCVPVTCDQLVTSDCQGIYDSKVSGMESVESMKSVSVVINNNSDSTVISCENASAIVVKDFQNNKAKESEISSVSFSAENDSSDQLYEVPLTGEEKHSAACTIPSPRGVLISSLTRRRGHSSSHDVFVKKEDNDGSDCTDPPAAQLVIFNSNGIEKSTSKWQLKGKRNSRQMSKKQEASRNVNGEEANNSSPLPLSSLFDVTIEVKANYSKPCVPLVSRMSKLNGKAIVGHPLTVEVLEEEGYGNGMVMSQVVVKANSVSKQKDKKRKSNGAINKSKQKKPSSLLVKTRRLSSLTSQKLTEKGKKQTREKAKETVVACIPLKVVFSRINEVLKGSARQTQHRGIALLPSSAKT
uniref:PWWP domain-containing protein n=1 Tax=Noccaea caerulescens TaxID=107243 RepID=A0A1J3GK00_NOCCA